MASNVETSEATRSQGAALILAIGTANPTTCYNQATFPDFLFRITEREDKTALKEKFKRICEKSGVKKRYIQMTEEMFKANPNLCTNGTSSYYSRQRLLLSGIPKLGEEAALKAIKEWGQPASRITHLVCSTFTSNEIPGLDYQLTELLNLNPDVQRYMFYQQGCYSGAAALRIAKDLAENNLGARVLVVCPEMLSIMFFHGPLETEPDHLVGNAIFGDGAAAVVVGAYPIANIERPLFQMESAKQVLIPKSKDVLRVKLSEVGATYTISPEIPNLVKNNIEECLGKEFSPIGISDWNSVFYIVHPGGPAILNEVNEKLGLEREKLRSSFHVLREYGNMGGPSVIFSLDELRKRSFREGKTTTGDGFEWGVLVGFGPGVTMEIIMLRSFPINVVGEDEC